MPKVLILKGEELEKILRPEVLVNEIAQAFKVFSEGKTVTPPRTVMWIEGNWWGIMQSYVPGYGVGVKIVNIVRENVKRGLPTIQAIVTLFDPITGSPLAVMEGGVLTALRTAAASAVSAKYMAPKEPGALAVIGTGYQARYQLKFVSAIFKPTEVRIYDIREEAMRKFREYAEGLGFKVVTCSSPSEVIDGARVVIEASTTDTPVIYGNYLKPPVHIISIGAHTPNARALDDVAIRNAESIVVDSRDAVLKETGDIRVPIEKGIINMDGIAELGEVVAGKRPGRVGDGVTIFKSVGLAIQDACAAALAYKIAKEKGVGSTVEL